jgi:hypothetical protein
MTAARRDSEGQANLKESLPVADWQLRCHWQCRRGGARLAPRAPSRHCRGSHQHRAPLRRRYDSDRVGGGPSKHPAIDSDSREGDSSETGESESLSGLPVAESGVRDDRQ